MPKECIIHGNFKDACNNGKSITGQVSEVIENFVGKCMYDVSLEMMEEVPLKDKNRYFGNTLGSSLKIQIKETANCALECLGNDGCKYKKQKEIKNGGKFTIEDLDLLDEDYSLGTKIIKKLENKDLDELSPDLFSDKFNIRVKEVEEELNSFGINLEDVFYSGNFDDVTTLKEWIDKVNHNTWVYQRVFL